MKHMSSEETFLKCNVQLYIYWLLPQSVRAVGLYITVLRRESLDCVLGFRSALKGICDVVTGLI